MKKLLYQLYKDIVWYDPLYKFKCFLFPHNVLKIKSLPKTFVDKDEMILHANFQILVNFVNDELKISKQTLLFNIHNEMINMQNLGMKEERINDEIEQMKSHNEYILEIMKLYKWWTIDRIKRENEYPKHECHDWADQYNKYIKMCDDEDNKMLLKLIQLRGYLWT